MLKNHLNNEKPILAKNYGKPKHKYIYNTSIQSFNRKAAQKKSFSKHCIQKLNNAVKHLDPCFLTTLVKGKYSEVLLENFF